VVLLSYTPTFRRPSVFILRVVELVWVWWATQSSIYTCSGHSQGCFGSLVRGELSRLVCPPRRVDYICILMFSRRTTLRMKTKMVFETSVSTKAEPHYPVVNPTELLHENSLVRRENIKMRISFTPYKTTGKTMFCH
jgi:hypothetical protein